MFLPINKIVIIQAGSNFYLTEHAHSKCASVYYCLLFLLFHFVTLFFSISAHAVPTTLSYQGRILSSAGTGLEHNDVSFIFKIYDPTGTCLIYQEQRNHIDLTGSKGVFDVSIGEGTVNYPSSGTYYVTQAFDNSSTITCQNSSTYTPTSTDGRLLRVTFWDGASWIQISPDNVIRAMPYAVAANTAEKLGTYVATDFLLKAGLPTCGAGTFLTWSGSALSCASVSGLTSGTVTQVTSGNSYISVATGTTTPLITLNVGTSAGSVAAGNDSRITGALQTGASAGGSLNGSYPNPSIADGAITGNALANSSVTTSKMFLNPGVNRLVATDSSTGTTLSALTCSSGQVLVWSVGTGWGCSNTSALTVGSASNFSGALSGDITGTQSATVVSKIGGYTLDLSSAPSTNQVLTWNGTKWIAASLPTAAVTSVAGKTGAVTLASADITDATDANTSSTIVRRNSSGNFSAGTITASNLVSGTLKLTTGAGSGKLLISDLDGNASWAALSTSQWTTSSSDIYYTTGNVGIGKAPGTNTKLDVAGQIVSSSPGSVTTGSINFSSGNAVSTSFDCSSDITFSNLRNGGNYLLVVTGAGTSTCNFSTSTSGDDSATVTYRFIPANGARTASSHTLYTLSRVGTNVYVTWVTGF